MRKISFFANRLLPAMTVILLPLFAIAEEATIEVAEPETIPQELIYQGINFLIFAGLLVYLLRKPIKGFFAGREENFRQALVKAEHARRDAEHMKLEVQQRIEKLQSTNDKSIADAKVEAEALRARIVKDAEEISQNLRAEAKRSTEFEIQRAKFELREELLNQSVAMSRKLLTEKIGEPDQKRLQTEFVEKIGEAR